MNKNKLILKLKLLKASKARLILNKIKKESVLATSCNFGCAGHNLPAHNSDE